MQNAELRATELADAHAVGETERAHLFEALERSQGALSQSEEARATAEALAKESQKIKFDFKNSSLRP